MLLRSKGSGLSTIDKLSHPRCALGHNLVPLEVKLPHFVHPVSGEDDQIRGRKTVLVTIRNTYHGAPALTSNPVSATRLGGEIDGDELSSLRIEDGHESLLFCWRRRNAGTLPRIKPC